MNQTSNRATIFFFLVIALFIYQSVFLFTALVLYGIAKLLRIDWKIPASVGMVSLIIMISLLFYQNGTLHHAIFNGFMINIYFWKTGFEYDFLTALTFLLSVSKPYYLLPFFFTGLMSVVQLIPLSAHEKAIKNVTRAKLEQQKEIKPSVIENKLKKMSDDNALGTLLGASLLSGKPVIVPDHYINQMLLVLGTTGAGKTITLQRFYKRAMQAGYPLIIVDGKPTEESVEWIKNQAQKANKPFFAFNCDNYRHYNPLAQGGHTELKDKIMTLKDSWDNDFYKTVAEDYLQTAFEVLLSQSSTPDLRQVTNCLDYDELVTLVRQSSNEELKKRVKKLAEYDRKDITGLQAHLNVLLNSELGHYFELDDTTFCISDVIKCDGVAYFALPALRYPTFAKVLGKLVINDIKTVIDREAIKKKIIVSFDEFSVFAGEQVLNLVNMGRGKGIHALFGTQGIPDLTTVSAEFANQLLNCVNTIICHRLNDQSSVEAISTWAGTTDTFSLTAQVDTINGGGQLGSVRQTKEFIVHPDAIKQKLLQGQAFFISKVGEFKVDKVKIKF